MSVSLVAHIRQKMDEAYSAALHEYIKFRTGAHAYETPYNRSTEHQHAARFREAEEQLKFEIGSSHIDHNQAAAERAASERQADRIGVGREPASPVLSRQQALIHKVSSLSAPCESSGMN